MVYDERRRFLPLTKQQGRVAGLTVATPSDIYYLFEARRDTEDDIVGRDPNAVVTALREQYRAPRTSRSATSRMSNRCCSSATSQASCCS